MANKIYYENVETLDIKSLEDKPEYTYPDSFDLSPGSKLTKTILAIVNDRARASHEVMSPRYSQWNNIERLLTVYVKPEVIADSKAKKEKTYPVIIPLSYATLETLLTYMTAAFLQEPYIRYKGTGDEDVPGALLMQKVVHTNNVRHKAALAFHTMWRDALAFGIGPISIGWQEHYAFNRRISKTRRLLGFGIPFKGRVRASRKFEKVFEGNRIYNIDPYKYYPDPAVAVHEIQDGSFWGWREFRTWQSLVAEESEVSSNLVNAYYTKGLVGQRFYSFNLDKTGEDSDNRISKKKGDKTLFGTKNNDVDILWMYVDLVPNDYEDFPNGKDPRKLERWLFGVAGGKIIISAEKHELDHNMFPGAVAAPEYDGYSISPISKLESIQGMQETVDFLFRSHITNVRKAVNDMFVVDPSLINIFDVAKPEPGKIIRLRRNAWGKGIKDAAISQLDVKDVTNRNIPDAMQLMDIARASVGTTDIVQGIMRSGGERRSATEARGVRSAALSRLEYLARKISAQTTFDIGYIMAKNVQQFMSQEVYVEIAGSLEEQLFAEYKIDSKRGRTRVRPHDLYIDVDIEPHDGTIPGNEPADLWIQLMQVGLANPAIAQRLDFIRIFKHVARQLGARNVDDFILKAEPEIQGNEKVMQQVQNGDLVPLEGNIL